MGFITGPRRTPARRARAAGPRSGPRCAASLWHELAIVLAARRRSWRSPGARPTRFGALDLRVLWVMRLSAKLNVFLGVRNLNAEFLPDHLRYLGSFLAAQADEPAVPGLGRRSATVGRRASWRQRRSPDPATPLEPSASRSLATLMALGVLEHWFLVLPLPAAALWSWSLTPDERPTQAADRSDRADLCPVTSPERTARSDRAGDAAGTIRESTNDRARKRRAEQHSPQPANRQGGRP